MKHTKTETWRDRRPEFLSDVAAMETWLEDWAAKGYQLTGFQGVNGIFVKAEPHTCRYRLQPLPKLEGSPHPEQEEIYREMGWTYVATMSDTYHVWRCDDPAAPELDTDPVVQGEGFRYLKRRMVRGLLLWPMVLLGLSALSVWIRAAGEFPLWHTVYFEAPGVMLYPWLIDLIAIAYLIWEYRDMRRLIYRLKNGIPLDRPAPYRWKQRVGTVLAIVAISSCWTPLISDIFGGSRTMRDPEQAAYVDLAVLDTEIRDTQFRQAGTKVHELAPRMYFVRQTAELPGGGQASADTEYYHMLTARLVPAMERDLLGWCGRSGSEPMEKIETAELDGFWWRDTGTEQEAVASLGQNILFLRYEGGSVDLRDAGAYLARVLGER